MLEYAGRKTDEMEMEMEMEMEVEVELKEREILFCIAIGEKTPRK
jgi:hypothetical protein